MYLSKVFNSTRSADAITTYIGTYTFKMGVGKRGAYYLAHGDLPRQHPFGTTLRFTGPVVPADSRQ